MPVPPQAAVVVGTFYLGGGGYCPVGIYLWGVFPWDICPRTVLSVEINLICALFYYVLWVGWCV